jgi:hypothetical protein
MRWKDNVERDPNNVGLKGLRTRAIDRMEWASFVRKATAKFKDHSANEKGEGLQEISSEVSYRWGLRC